YMPPQQAATEAPDTQRATEQLQIDFTTTPNPPRKGTNTLQVKVTSTGGKPVVGIRATVTFFMAAMPAMGMAAGHASAVLTDKAIGTYEGQVQLDSGGTWQV